MSHTLHETINVPDLVPDAGIGTVTLATSLYSCRSNFSLAAAAP
jgi:hypothetical protein